MVNGSLAHGREPGVGVLARLKCIGAELLDERLDRPCFLGTQLHRRMVLRLFSGIDAL